MSDDLVKRMYEAFDSYESVIRKKQVRIEQLDTENEGISIRLEQYITRVKSLEADKAAWINLYADTVTDMQDRIEKLEAALRDIADGTEEELTHDISSAALAGKNQT